MPIEDIAAYVRRQLAERPPKPLTDSQVHKLRILFGVSR